MLSAELQDLKGSLGFRPEGEIKWGKVSRTYLDRYRTLLGWMFGHLKSNHWRFRAHVVDTTSPAYRRYGKGDLEQSFYKVYYHLLYQSVKRLALDEDGSNVVILLDDKRDRYPFRLDVLKKSLNAGLRRDLGASRLIASVEPRPSNGPRAEPLVQIVDVLIGAIGYVRNGHPERSDASPSKVEMVRFLEGAAGTGFGFDTAAWSPFNLWTFDVSVAMERKKEHKKKNRPGT